MFVVKDGDFEITRTKKVSKRDTNQEVDPSVARSLLGPAGYAHDRSKS